MQYKLSCDRSAVVACHASGIFSSLFSPSSLSPSSSPPLLLFFSSFLDNVRSLQAYSWLSFGHLSWDAVPQCLDYVCWSPCRLWLHASWMLPGMSPPPSGTSPPPSVFKPPFPPLLLFFPPHLHALPFLIVSSSTVVTSFIETQQTLCVPKLYCFPFPLWEYSLATAIVMWSNILQRAIKGDTTQQ